MELRDYVTCDGLSLGEMIRRGEVTADALEACTRAAVAAVNPQINAVIELYDTPDQRTAAPSGPFAGVPFLVKDMGMAPAGARRECGSRLARGMTADHPAAVLERLTGAGFRVLGRTASPEMAFNVTTENILHGPTRNPWDRTRSAGGSSGGAAAAVAAGIVPMAEANDGGGSIRIPAACCGVFGLKPSRGRTSAAPDAWEFLNGLSSSHVVSRTVRDSAAALDAAAGAEPGDPYIITPPARPYLEDVSRGPGRLRIAVTTDAPNANAPNGSEVDPACARATEDAAKLCADLGHDVDRAAPDLGLSWAAFVEANARVWCANMARLIDAIAAATGRTPGPDTLEATTLACYHYGKTMSADDLLAALDGFNAISRAVGAFFSRYDILVTPTLPAPPLPLGACDANEAGLGAIEWADKLFGISPFTPLFNVTGQPAMSVPLGQTADGLPVGIQFAAGLNREDLLFGLAGQLETAAPWIHRHPPILAAKV